MESLDEETIRIVQNNSSWVTNMRDFLLTLRFLLKNTFSLNHFVHRINNDKQSRLIFILVAFALLTLIPTYVLMMTGLVNF